MIPKTAAFTTACVLLLCQALVPIRALGESAGDYDYADLASVETLVDDQVYRLGASGVCGSVEDDHIRVVRVLADSPAHGKIKPGDQIRGLQYRGLGGNIRRTVAKRIYRLGRDWDWQLAITLERPSARGGRGNQLTFHLRLPPTPGILQHFGPTGIYGRMYPDHIVVERLAKGSPAEGTLQAGDRIVAVNGEELSGDLFVFWTRHIDQAETAAAGGDLRLTVRRPKDSPAPSGQGNDPGGDAFKELNLSLQLEVLGSYSPTAPVNCPKTKTIVSRTAEQLIRTEKHDRLGISLLGLLATGEERFIDYVGRVLHKSDFAHPDVELSMHKGYVSWPYSYHTILMSEYYLLSGDSYVLPSIEKHAVLIARGQDAAGLWNHRMANPAANFGKLHGRLYGYGAINQTSIALWISLILAEKCGVDHLEVENAIDKTHNLYRNWIGRGSLPYGNHSYVETFFTNNGTSGSIAVAFSLLNNRAGARYFSRLSAAAHKEILTGHTGPFFNSMWSGPGANVAGPDVAAEFSQNVHWLRTMTRTWDDRFLYMEARGGNFAYKACSSDGAALLNLCLGRRALWITGKGSDRSIWLHGEDAAQLVEAGQLDTVDSASLLRHLGSPLPPVRLRAAELLAVKDGNVSAEVMRMLASGRRDQRIGAIHAIQKLAIHGAVDELMAIAADEEEDLWIRVLALRTLPELEGAERYAPELLRIILPDKPYDPRGDLDIALGNALATLLQRNPLEHELDTELFYQAANKLLDHQHMWGRSAGMKLLKTIPLEDLYRVAEKMLYVIEDRDRTYTSYHGDGHRQAGLEILNRLDIQEVIPLTVNTIKESTGRMGARVRGRMRLLPTFGANAKPFIPAIKEALGKRADDLIQTIQNASEKRDMISLEEAKRTGRGKADPKAGKDP